MADQPKPLSPQTVTAIRAVLVDLLRRDEGIRRELAACVRSDLPALLAGLGEKAPAPENGDGAVDVTAAQVRRVLDLVERTVDARLEARLRLLVRPDAFRRPG